MPSVLAMVLQVLSRGGPVSLQSMCFCFEKWLSEEARQEIVMFYWAVALRFLGSHICFLLVVYPVKLAPS